MRVFGRVTVEKYAVEYMYRFLLLELKERYVRWKCTMEFLRGGEICAMGIYGGILRGGKLRAMGLYDGII